ncbi:prepilin-type N-terminal cleavage/methylation domain-containing protein [Parelusimicrobium proximum]|uniref:type IV pilin protein n=1 Tax=Parelusimicrobium proximum TaxID=3228953 RepID=UPI003D16E7ED
MKKGFNNNHVGAESFAARLASLHSVKRAEKDSAPATRKRSSRCDDLFKSSLLRTPSSSLPLYSVGFTLIELLVVVLIIAILAAVALPQYTKAVNKSRYTEFLLMTRALRDAQQRYFLQNDEYANSIDKLDVSLPSGYTACREQAKGTVYSNGKYQIDVDKNGVGMGKVTSDAACAVSFAGGTIMAYALSGGNGNICEDGTAEFCMTCSETTANKGLCASLGGTPTSTSESRYFLYK